MSKDWVDEEEHVPEVKPLPGVASQAGQLNKHSKKRLFFRSAGISRNTLVSLCVARVALKRGRGDMN